MLAERRLLAAGPPSAEDRPLAPRSPQFPARAKRVLHIFCTGAVSHLDTWDYKPESISRKCLRGNRLRQRQETSSF